MPALQDLATAVAHLTGQRTSPVAAAMPQRILLATDGTSQADAACAWAAWLSPSWIDVLAVGKAPGDDAAAQAALRLAKASLLRATGPGPGPEIAARLVHGDPANVILDQAKASEADLLVLASHDQSKLPFPGVPGVARAITAAAITDVLLTRGGPPPRVVVAAVDGSAPSLRATLLAAAIARQAQAVLRILYVADKEPSDKRSDLDGLVVHLQTMRGDPAMDIVRFARRSDAEVLVLGSRGLGGVAGWRLGSISEYVAEKASCSVLLARSDGSLA